MREAEVYVEVKWRSIAEALSEVQRELRVRQRCYPRWQVEGKIDVIDAMDRLDRLQAAVHYLEECKFQEEQVKGFSVPSQQ